jgi:hypothetical protein
VKTKCLKQKSSFESHGRQEVVAAFDGGKITSDAGGLLRDVEEQFGILRPSCGGLYRSPACAASRECHRNWCLISMPPTIRCMEISSGNSFTGGTSRYVFELPLEDEVHSPPAVTSPTRSADHGRGGPCCGLLTSTPSRERSRNWNASFRNCELPQPHAKPHDATELTAV